MNVEATAERQGQMPAQTGRSGPRPGLSEAGGFRPHQATTSAEKYRQDTFGWTKTRHGKNDKQTRQKLDPAQAKDAQALCICAKPCIEVRKATARFNLCGFFSPRDEGRKWERGRRKKMENPEFGTVAKSASLVGGETAKKMSTKEKSGL